MRRCCEMHSKTRWRPTARHSTARMCAPAGMSAATAGTSSADRLAASGAAATGACMCFADVARRRCSMGKWPQRLQQWNNVQGCQPKGGLYAPALMNSKFKRELPPLQHSPHLQFRVQFVPCCLPGGVCPCTRAQVSPAHHTTPLRHTPVSHQQIPGRCCCSCDTVPAAACGMTCCCAVLLSFTPCCLACRHICL